MNRRMDLMGRLAPYVLLGYALLMTAGCRNECPRKPLTSRPTITNPHPDLFSDVFDDFQEMVEGDFVYDYWWTANQKYDSNGTAQMDSISKELRGKRTSARKTGSDELLLRVENDDVGKADHNGDGTRDFVGRVGRGNKLAVTDFPKFDDFDKKILSYEYAVQNATFYTKKNLVNIANSEAFGVANTGLYCGLPGIAKARADFVITYKDGGMDILRFDTFSTPIDPVPGSDLDMFAGYFASNPGGILANTNGRVRVLIFTDGHTNDARDRLGARELNRVTINRGLYRK